MQSLHWLVDLARKTDVARIVINGSFVTEAYEPNDVDCLVLVGPAFLRDTVAQSEMTAGFPFLQVEAVSQEDFDYMVNVIYGSDREGVPKGMVEIVQWN